MSSFLHFSIQNFTSPIDRERSERRFFFTQTLHWQASVVVTISINFVDKHFFSYFGKTYGFFIGVVIVKIRENVNKLNHSLRQGFFQYPIKSHEKRANKNKRKNKVILRKCKLSPPPWGVLLFTCYTICYRYWLEHLFLNHAFFFKNWCGRAWFAKF